LEGDFGKVGGSSSKGKGVKSKLKRKRGEGEGEGDGGGAGVATKGKRKGAAAGGWEARWETAEGAAEYLWETVTEERGPGLTSAPEAGRFLVPEGSRGVGMADAVKAMGPVWRRAFMGDAPPVAPGRPRVLVVCASALRAVDVCKQLGPVLAPRGKDLHVARLFAKHKKVDDQVHFLHSFKCALAVGTPNRILRLLEGRPGANGKVAPLDLSDLALVIFDLWHDAKGFHVLTLKDTRADVTRLYLDHIHPILADTGEGPRLWLRPEASRHVKLG